MSTGLFCVPTPCSLAGNPPGCLYTWCNFLRNRPVSNNSLYNIGYITQQYIPIWVNGIGSILQDDLSSWLTRQVIINTVPYVVTFIALFITLMILDVISVAVGIVLIISLLIITIVCVTWILEDASDSVYQVVNQVENKIIENWETNKSRFFRYLTEAIINPDGLSCPNGCPVTEEIIKDEELFEKYRQYGEDITDCQSCK